MSDIVEQALWASRVEKESPNGSDLFALILAETAAEITRLRAALDAERERCARVAKQLPWIDPLWSPRTASEVTSEYIAAAIRATPSPGGTMT